MKEEELVYIRQLAMVEGLGWRRFQLLREYFGSARKVWEAEPEEWLAGGVPKGVVESFGKVKEKNLTADRLRNTSSRGSVPPSSDFSELGIGVVVYEEKEYPERLREIGSPPLGLFYEGRLSLLKKAKMMAVVGTRRMTRYGERVTRRLVRELVKHGWVIVSGLARGVDGVAHEECLWQGGKTVAVLAHGLGMTYPKEHEDLRKRIVERGGVVVSEYAPWVKPRPEYFASRNRIVAGLSERVLVTEAYKQSGTKITVGFALEQGKDVYVVPGLLEMPSYRGCLEMIEEGARPVVDYRDIIL